MTLSIGPQRTPISVETPIDQRSFEEVFVGERTAMVRLAYLLMGSEALAEEAVQEAFARLLDRWDSIANPGGFVRTTTVNRCRDLLRRRSTTDRLLRRLHGDPTDGPAAGFSNDRSDSIHVLDLLARLDQDRREVLVLRFYLGHTANEIAALLDIPPGTVRSRMQRGLEDLRGALT